MAAATTSAPVLIIYDKLNTTQENGSVVVQLQRYLSAKGMEYTLKDYADTFDPSALPQYLILVYSSQSQKPPQLDKAVDRMLDLVVQRRMRSIVAITTAPPSGFSPVTVSLPPKWASIPTYNASSYSDKNQLAEDVLREAQSAKLPYSQAQAQQSLTQRAQSFAGAKLRNVPVSLPSVLIVLVCVLIVGAVGIGAFIYLRPATQSVSPSLIKTTPTTLASKATFTYETKTAATATSQTTPIPDSEQQAKQEGLKKITKGPSTVSGFQASDGWSRTSIADEACTINDTNYTVNIKLNAQYDPCIAKNLSYKNFALQVKMDVKGDAGGIIFRYNDTSYYRLSVKEIYISTNIPAFSLFVCDNGKCDGNGTDSGTSLGTVNAAVDKYPITLAVVARDKNIDIYANGKYVYSFVQKADAMAGQVGVYAADLNNETTVTFSDLKIWSLDNK